MQKGWRKTRVTVAKMISSVKKRFPTLADFRVKRKMMRQDRHAGRETPERHEHSKNAENPFIAAPNVFETDPTAPRNIFRHWRLRWPGSASPATVTAMIYESFCGGGFANNLHSPSAPGGRSLFVSPP